MTSAFSKLSTFAKAMVDRTADKQQKLIHLRPMDFRLRQGYAGQDAATLRESKMTEQNLNCFFDRGNGISF